MCFLGGHGRSGDGKFSLFAVSGDGVHRENVPAGDPETAMFAAALRHGTLTPFAEARIALMEDDPQDRKSPSR